MSHEPESPALRLNEESGFVRRNGIQVVSAEREKCTLKTAISADSKNI